MWETQKISRACFVCFHTFKRNVVQFSRFNLPAALSSDSLISLAHRLNFVNPVFELFHKFFCDILSDAGTTF